MNNGIKDGPLFKQILKEMKERIKCQSTLNKIEEKNNIKKFNIAEDVVTNITDKKLTICSEEGCYFQEIEKETGPFKIKLKEQNIYFNVKGNSLGPEHVKDFDKGERKLHYKEIPLTPLSKINNKKFLDDIDVKLKNQINQLPSQQQDDGKQSQADLDQLAKVKEHCLQKLLKDDLKKISKSSGNKSQEIKHKSGETRVVKDKAGSIEDATPPISDRAR